MARARALSVTVQDVSGAAGVPPAAKLEAWARCAFGARARGEVTVRVVTARESAALNKRYRRKRGATNVLSFPADPPRPLRGAESLPIGDLVICAAVVEREARAQRKPQAAHWAHMVVHGVLHLQGYDHETESQARLMEARERKLLATLGFPDPYSRIE
jgi:probable rRNA maturation factor